MNIRTFLSIGVLLFQVALRAEFNTVGQYSPGPNNYVDQSATYMASTGSAGPENIISLSTFSTLILDAYSKNLGGVVNFEPPGSMDNGGIIANYGTSLFKSLSINNGSNSYKGPVTGYSDNRIAVSGAYYAQGFESKDWIFNINSIEPVTHFGLTVIDRDNSIINPKATAIFSNGSSVTSAAIMNGSAPSSDQDTFFGFSAPNGEYIVSVRVDNEAWTVFDDVAFITNGTSAIATYPNPSDGVGRVSETSNLLWIPASDSGLNSQEVFFGTDPNVLIKVMVGDSTLNTVTNDELGGPLQYGTTYYWRIDSNLGTGTVWSFTTRDNIYGYYQRVKRYADTMLLYGTDRYGTQVSPLFATALTRNTIPELLVESPKEAKWPPRFTLVPNIFLGGDHAHKVTIRGANVGTDDGLYPLLYLLSGISRNPAYQQAADTALTWFAQNTPDPVTGLFTWGEHTGWDFRKETYVDGDDLWSDPTYWAKHEFSSSPQFFLEKIGELYPEAVVNFAYGLTQHVYWESPGTWFSGDTGFRYSRHGKIGVAGNARAIADKGMYPRHGGYMVNVMSAAYFYSPDPNVRIDMINQINTCVSQWEAMVANYGYVPYDLTNGISSESQNAELATELRFAAIRLIDNEPIMSNRLIQLADQIYTLPTAYQLAEGWMTNEIKPRDLGKNTNYVTKPDYNIGWDLPGRVPAQHADVIIKLVNAAEENLPEAPYTSEQYLERAIYFADEAIDLYLNDGTNSPLPRNLDRNSSIILVDGITSADAFYHSYCGSDNLMFAILRLFAALKPNEPIEGDIYLDGKINMIDLLVFIEQWLQSNCQVNNQWCQDSDVDFDKKVTLSDFVKISDNWLR